MRIGEEKGRKIYQVEKYDADRIEYDERVNKWKKSENEVC